MFTFLPLINNSVTIELSLLFLSIQQLCHQKQLVFHVSYMDYIIQCFYEP